MIENAILSQNLSKTFKSGFSQKPVEALKSVTFNIPTGSVTGFLGPNGSGKSTFLKIAAKLIKPTSGKVKFFDKYDFSEIKQDVSFVPEKPNYPGALSGRDILNFHAKVTKSPLSRIKEVTELVELDQAINRSFQTYSKGMRQRLAIAQALLSDPKLLILDEPLSGLDPDGREVLIQAILGFSQKEGKTVILSSHLLEDLQRICNNLVILRKGEVIFSGNPASVFKPDSFVIRFQKKDQSKNINVSAAELNSKLKSILEEDVKILSVEPETKAISSVYFELTRGK